MEAAGAGEGLTDQGICCPYPTGASGEDPASDSEHKDTFEGCPDTMKRKLADIEGLQRKEELKVSNLEDTFEGCPDTMKRKLADIEGLQRKEDLEVSNLEDTFEGCLDTMKRKLADIEGLQRKEELKVSNLEDTFEGCPDTMKRKLADIEGLQRKEDLKVNNLEDTFEGCPDTMKRKLADIEGLQRREELKVSNLEDTFEGCLDTMKRKLADIEGLQRKEELKVSNLEDTFESCLDAMKRKVTDIEGLQRKEELKVSNLEDQITKQKEQITSGFEELQQFLENEKLGRLSTLEHQRTEILQGMEETLATLQEQRASLASQIAEMESQRQQPDVELPKDTKETDLRSEHSKDSNCFKKEDGDGEEKEEKRLRPSFCQQPFDLQEDVIDCLEWRWARSHFAVPVILDPDSAHICLALSEDGKRVKNTGKWPHLPNNSKRFSDSRCVLGKEMFSSGKHYWEVQIVRDGGWSVGVARESVSRKQEVTESPEGDVWAVGRWNRMYMAYTAPPSPLCLRQRPLRLGVYLNYERGQLSVFNSDTMEGLHTFTGAAFEDYVSPYFWLWEGTDLQLV